MTDASDANQTHPMYDLNVVEFGTEHTRIWSYIEVYAILFFIFWLVYYRYFTLIGNLPSSTTLTVMIIYGIVKGIQLIDESNVYDMHSVFPCMACIVHRIIRVHLCNLLDPRRSLRR